MSNKFASILLALLFFCSPIFSGPLFDDYLNYARLGEQICCGDSEIALTKKQTIGQSFRVQPGTSEIYRIGLRANSEPDSWSADETVTLSLYDSPKKGRKLASYSIDGATCRIKGIREDEKVRILLFPLRAKVSGMDSAYFELSVEGGDESVRFFKAGGGGYEGGEGYLNGQPQMWDLVFETHIKPVADRIENLRKFWSGINLELPELAAVKAAVEVGDYDKAQEEFVNHFHNRMDLYDKSLFSLNINPDFDRTFANLLASGKLWKTEEGKLKEIIPWRTKSYWAPDYVKWGKNYEPDITGGWHIERTLFGAYSATGEEKYARAGIDLRMQFILDNNPSPKVTGIRAPQDIWNELTAGRARGPGHLPYIYSRIHEYNGISADEKMLYFLNWFDNAEYLYESPVGGNWGFQAAESCYEFGKKFPEYKKSEDFKTWGSKRLTELTLQTVRGDGTQNEAAIKYHAMCARRLISLMNDYSSGLTKLDNLAIAKLKTNFEKLYEHMAYVLQPDNYVVMYGDAWHEDYSEELKKVGEMINRPDFVYIATQGKEGSPPKEVSKYFPDGGFFIMRSDFGGPGKDYKDARQLFVHNGGWVGSHGHFGLTSIALYGYGRTLLIDPGGMWDPSYEQIWWKSFIHSMLVPDQRDCSRQPGENIWVSSPSFDYFDGYHAGYRKIGVSKTRRRILFVKPDYFVVDDYAKSENEFEWDQVWNVFDKNAKVDPKTKAIQTTHPYGNLLIHPADALDFEVHSRSLQFPMNGRAESKVFYYRKRTSNPRFTTILYPYKTIVPSVEVSSIMADDQAVSDKVKAVKLVNGKLVDLVIFGDLEAGKVTFGGKHELDGEMLAVRTESGGKILGYSCHRAVEATFNRRVLLSCDRPIASLDVVFNASNVEINVREEHPSLTIWVGNAKSFTVNGKKLAIQPVNGFIKPFAKNEMAIYVDDNSEGFRRVTETDEWEMKPNLAAFDLTHTIHETDPGRKEAAVYVTRIPVSGKYKLEVHIPSTTTEKTDAMEYVVSAAGNEPAKPAKAGGAVLKVASDEKEGRYSFMVNQQNLEGWLDLGEYYFEAGKATILTATNITSIDGLYPVWDAIRLTPKGEE